MKTLVLMRHAKAENDSPTFEDRDRALSPRGHTDAELVANALAARGHKPELILCSSARRTQETCAHLVEVFGRDSHVRLMPDLYLATDLEILEHIRDCHTDADVMMVVGHNPGMEILATDMAADGAPPKFPTAAVAVFSFDVEEWKAVKPGSGRFVDYLTPKVLKG